MTLDQPLIFEPVYMERVWGGRRLESHFHRSLPPGATIGESWELVDRPEAQSVVHNGPLRGQTLHELWTNQRPELFGKRTPETKRFPLLVKILDCQEILSLQVHPPSFISKALNADPKTEMWYIVKAEPGSEIYAGIKHGVKPEDFVRALEKGEVVDLIHNVKVNDGDFMFIPSGRVHAIGRGNLIFEIQQNSDTTYRVFDWNRVGLDGQPRTLHIEESLRSIQWDDFEPAPGQAEGENLVKCEHFEVDRLEFEGKRRALDAEHDFAIFGVLQGRMQCGTAEFAPGQFFLVPKCMQEVELEALEAGSKVLRARLPG